MRRTLRTNRYYSNSRYGSLNIHSVINRMPWLDYKQEAPAELNSANADRLCKFDSLRQTQASQLIAYHSTHRPNLFLSEGRHAVSLF